jgi:hypothetical protein
MAMAMAMGMGRRGSLRFVRMGMLGNELKDALRGKRNRKMMMGKRILLSD